MIRTIDYEQRSDQVERTDQETSINDDDHDVNVNVDADVFGDVNKDNNNKNKDETTIVSCFRNKNLPAYWRYGIPIYLLLTSVLLTIANVGSGVTAETIITSDGKIFDQSELIRVSIASSIAELWKTESYPLAIFIAITSMFWPYGKLIAGLLAWVLPIKNHRQRELLVEIVDATDKWSFVDIFVFVIIMVSFRSTINAGLGVKLEVAIVPLWGFYLFIFANMLSLLGTHMILFHHRRLQKMSTQEQENENVKNNEKSRMATNTKTNSFLLTAVILLCIAFHVTGIVLKIFEVQNTRSTQTFNVQYSILDVGYQIPGATFTPSDFGVRFIQAMYYILEIGLPIWNSILFASLYFIPLLTLWQERIFLLAQITFSWQCVEVMTLSIIFSVLQMPKFGNGLIDAGCSECYRVDSRILIPSFAVVCVSTVLNVATNLWLYQRTHRFLYPHNKPHK